MSGEDTTAHASRLGAYCPVPVPRVTAMERQALGDGGDDVSADRIKKVARATMDNSSRPGRHDGVTRA